MRVMFRFYSNENISLVLVGELRHFGYDVLTSHEAGNANQRIPDEQVLTTATEQGRCVATFNRDDFLALHRRGIPHAGIVVFKDDRDYASQALLLHEFLEQQLILANRLIRIQRQNEPKSSHQSFVIREY